MNRVSYCAVHNTYPEAGEPCWACANPFIQKAYEEGVEAAQQSFAPDATNTPRIVEVLDENGNPQKIAVI